MQIAVAVVMTSNEIGSYMKHSVTKFKCLAIALKELEPIIKNGAMLKTGRPVNAFGNMLPREILANWLICAVLNHEYTSERYQFTTDPTGGDGVIVDTEKNDTWLTEHVMVPPPYTSQEKIDGIATRILNAVMHKQKKGEQYASGKQLVVFLEDGRGVWLPNETKKQLPRPLLFEDVWVVGLQHCENDEYCYAVTELDATYRNAPAWTVAISHELNKWIVTRLQ
jgi:hypothetical protein